MDQQVKWFGQDQATAPPDTQLAAGATMLVEMTNSSGSVWSKTGLLLSHFDLNTFYMLPAGFSAGDPRVLYDPAVDRWFASAMAFDAAFNSQVYLAVSETSDPTGLWFIYVVAGNTVSILDDQPKLGITSDKIVLSWNDHSAAGTFLGQETWILQKASAVSGQPFAYYVYGPDPHRFNLVAAQIQSSTSTAFLGYNGALLRGSLYAGPYVGVVAITGTPAQGNLTWSERDLTIATTNLPPDAQQKGSLTLLDTSDDRFGSVSWQSDTLWVAGTDGCIPGGDSVARACARLIKISTAGTPAVVEDFDFVTPGSYLFYPAVAADGAGNMFVTFTQSSAGLYPSLVGNGQLASRAFLPGVLIASGQGAYDCGACANRYGSSRWGDYSAAQMDPSVPTTVWVAGEYAPLTGVGAAWGTAIGSLTFSAGTDQIAPVPAPWWSRGLNPQSPLASPVSPWWSRRPRP